MAYQLRGAGLYCDRHDTAFAKEGNCAGCTTDPGPPPAAQLDVEVGPPPTGCRSTQQLEQLLNDDLDELRELRRKLSGKSLTRTRGKGKRRTQVLDLHAYNTIAKLADATTKVARALLEIALSREDEEIVRSRARLLKSLKGGRN